MFSLRRAARTSPKSGGVFEASKRARATVAAGVALILVSPFFSVVPGAAAADLVPVLIDLSKTTTAPADGDAAAGESVVFDFTITCSSTQSDCVNLKLTDNFPVPLVFDTVNTNSNYTIGASTNGFVLTFTNALDEGGIGLGAGEQVTFQAVGHVDPNVDASLDGTTVTNIAYATVDNPDSNNQSSAPVKIIAPLVVKSTITKTVTPNTLTGFPNVPVAFALTAQNTSNALVGSLQISDPAEAVLPTNAYEYLTVTGFTMTFPTGATRVRIDRYDGTQWINGTRLTAANAALPSAVPTGVIKGLRFTFSDNNATPGLVIARNATASVTINTVTTADVANLTTPFNGLNIASSQAVRGNVLGTIVSANGPFTINPAAIRPTATKVFSSHDVVGGQNLTATLTGTNGGDFTLSELAIVEPQTATSSFADQGLEFVAINQAQVFWPTGATSVDVTYIYDDALGNPTVNWTTPRNTLPTPATGRTVIGFTATFKGSMAPGQYATVPFTVHTLTPINDTSTTNTIRVDARTAAGQTASATASDVLLRRSSRINTTINKTIAPGSIFATANAPLLLSLRSQIDPRPTILTDTTGSTIGATKFVIEDKDADFWEIFNPTNIVATEVPSGSTLVIEYSTDGGATYTGTLFPATAGPTTANVAIPAGVVSSINALRFTYTPTVANTLLQPGFNVQPNIKVRLRTTERTSGADVFAPGATLARVENNTATSHVENSNTGQFGDDDDTEPATVQPAPSDGGPGYDLIEKNWVEDEVQARSSQNATTIISWGTGGQEYNSVVISDTPDNSSTAVGDPSMGTVDDTVYDSFDLFSIAPITATTDPLIAYDSVSAVQYFSRTTNQWEPLNDNNATLCNLGNCNGSFPGYTLSAAERADAIGVRLVFVENPNRSTTPTSATAPLKGSGVAATTTLNRHLSLVFQLRTVLRSDPATAVLGVSREQVYNTGAFGQVSNGAGIEGRDATAAIIWTENDSDEILIIDSSLNVRATKTWVDGPLGVPPVGTPQSLFPMALMTITAQNATVVPVNELKLEEATGGTTPFQYVNIVKIEKLSGSTDTTSTAVLTYADGSSSAAIPINTLVTMNQLALQDVVGITLTKAGPIATSEIIGLQLHTQLREFVRGSTTLRTSPMTVQNQITATVTDPGGNTVPDVSTAPNNVVHDYATASVDIQTWTYGVLVNKSISATTAEFGPTSSTSTTGSSTVDAATAPTTVNGQPQTAAIQYDNGETISKRAVVTVSGQPTGNVRTTDLALEDTSPTFWNVYNFVSLDATALADTRKRVQVDVLIGSGAWGYGVTYDTTAGITSTCAGDVAHPDCWIIGTPGLTATLPTMPGGSQTSDIRGLRFTFTNADGTAWEREYNPPMTAKFTVDRRATLVSSPATAVPSTLSTYPGATPGETTQGIFTNTVTATASARPAAGAPLWTAHADATAQIRYQHLPARVKITKTPFGQQSLNTDIPYKIVVTNTGGAFDRPLGNIVVTDALPVNTAVTPNATMLVIPNDEDGEPQTINDVTSIRVASSSNATLPSPAFAASLGPITGATQTILFDFADSWVLPRGASLTITVRLQFPPQLEAGTRVTNTATVTADQVFETCEWTLSAADLLSNVPQPPRSLVNDCYSSTTVFPLASAPVTIVKGVRGVGAGPLDATGTPIDSDPGTAGIQPYDDLGILKTVPGSGVNCASPNVFVGVQAEYYRYPCVPITRPGGTEEWASTFTNGGNIGLTQIVAIDVLPAPGDKGVIVNEDRGTKWTPVLTTVPTLVGLPEDATYTISYLTSRTIASQRCNGADIQHDLGLSPTSTPTPSTSGYNDCFTNSTPVDSVAKRQLAWQTMPASPTAALLATVVAMKFNITMTNAKPLTPGSKLSIIYQSRTAAVISVAETVDTDAQSIAYNSIAAAAAGWDSAKGLTVPNRFVTEPRKVGVAMATGSIQLRKATAGAGAGYARTTFSITATCTSAGVALTPITRTVTRNATAATVIEGLPLYASCVITEANTYNETVRAVTPGTVIAQAPQTANAETILDPNPAFNSAARPAVEVSTVTNTYELTQLTITKSVNNSGAVDALTAGAAVTPSGFVYSISCTFNNGSTGSPPVVYTQTGITLNNGGTFTTPMDPTSATIQNRGIPVGSICTVTETDSQEAQTVSWTSTVATADPLAPVVTSGSYTRPPGTANATANPNVAGTLTLGRTTNGIAFTNTFGVASLTINKVVDGAWATTAATPAHTTGLFTVTVVCVRDINAAAGDETTFSGTFTLSAPSDLTRTISNIAEGSKCTVTEPGNAGANRVAITTTGGVTSSVLDPIVGANTRVITNSFDEASLSVTKTVETDAVDASNNPKILDAPYTIGVACTFQGSSVYGTGYSSTTPMSLVFTAADFGTGKTSTKKITGLPTGAACRVTESAFPANATNVRINWSTSLSSGVKDSTDPAAPSALISSLTADGAAAATTNAVTVTNSYGVGTFTVTKVRRGDAAGAFGLGPFTVHVVCRVDGVTTPSYEGDVTLTPTHLSETISNLVTGSKCSAVETGTGRSAPDAVRYADAFGDTTDGAGVDVMGSNPTVTITNWYLTGSVTVTKSVLETAGYTFGTGPFEIELSCSRALTGPAATVTTTVTRTIDPATPASMTQTFTDLPSDATCTLRETDDGGASSTTITNGTQTSSTAAVGITFAVTLDKTILLTADQVLPAITVTNSFTEAALRVTKAIDSDALDAAGNPLGYGPFRTTVTCEFNGSPAYGTGYSLGTPMVKDLVAGVPWDIVGLPTGAECVVTESDVVGAVSTSVTTVEADGTPVTTSFSDPSVTIPTTSLVLGPLSEPNSVTLTNFYDEGSIALSKEILGTAKATWGDTDFTVNVTCTLSDPTNTLSARGEVLNKDYAFSNSAGLGPELIDHLPTGAVCVITETDDGTATATDIDVTEPGAAAATTTPGTTVTVTVTNDPDPTLIEVNNTFDYTILTVQKEVSGDPTGLYGVGPFEVTLSCTFDGDPIDAADIPLGLVRQLTLANSYFTSYTNLPVGAECEVEETNTGGANSTEVRLGLTGTPVAGTSLDVDAAPGISEVYVENFYEVGGMTVNKTVTGDSFLYGDGSPLYSNIGFEVEVTCERPVDGVMTAVAVPDPTYIFGAGNGWTHDFVNLPVGAVCAVTETQKGFAASSTVGPPVTIVANGLTPPAVSIEVVNDFQLGTLALGKESLGLFAARHAGESFQVTVECWQDVNGVLTKIDPIKDGEVRTIKSGEQTKFEDLPVPAACTFDELDNGGADMGIYRVSAIPMVGSTVTVMPVDLDIQLDNLFMLASTGRDADVWIIGALISLLSGVCLVVIGRRRERVRPTATR